MRSYRKTSQLDPWRKSAEFREIARQSIQRVNAARRLAPKCGAKRKSDGEPCQNLPLANGRCRYHGGRTPSGKQWHKEQLPTRPGPRDVEKLDKKLSELQRRRKRRAARVEEMTPPERERYEAWQPSHKPGGPAARERNRQDRAARKLISKLLGDNEAGRAAAQTGSVFD